MIGFSLASSLWGDGGGLGVVIFVGVLSMGG